MVGQKRFSQCFYLIFFRQTYIDKYRVSFITLSRNTLGMALSRIVIILLKRDFSMNDRINDITSSSITSKA